MSEKIQVKPTPIQRNEFDVAVELVELHGSLFGFPSTEEIEKCFIRYYAVAKTLDALPGRCIHELVPDELKEIVKRLNKER